MQEITRVVKYNNDLHKSRLTGWTSVDMNIFFSILSVIKEKGNSEITLSLKDIKELSRFKRNGAEEWKKQVKQTADKVMALRYYEESEKGFSIMALFTKFTAVPETEEIKVHLSDNWGYILNSLGSNFTKYDLPDFLSIKSSYSKTIFRYLKQWRTFGKYEVKLEDFKSILDIPEKYDSRKINARILPVIEKDMKTFFEDFKIETIKSNKKGSPVIGYEFTWTPEAREKFNPDKYKKLDNGDPNNYSNSVLKEYNFSPNHSRKYTKVGEMNYLKLDNFKDTKSSRNRYDLSHWVDENGEVVVFETWEGSLLREKRRYDDDHVEKIFPKNIKINIPEDILKELKEYTPEEIQIVSNDPEGEALIKELIEEGFFDD